MILCKYSKKNHHLQKYLSCHSTLGRYIHLHILQWTQSQHFSVSSIQGISKNFAGSTIFFFIAALVTWWFGQIVALPQWAWLLLLRYFFINNLTWWYLLFPLFLRLFRPYFAVTNLWVSRSLKRAHSWEIVLVSFLKISSQFNG